MQGQRYAGWEIPAPTCVVVELDVSDQPDLLRINLQLFRESPAMQAIDLPVVTWSHPRCCRPHD